MRLLHAFTGLLALRIASVFALNGYIVPPGSPGYQHGNSTQHIQFDSTSLYVDGKRIFLYGGEFHYWRLPVQALWSDILEKLKASGQNAVSIYVHWGTTEGKQGVRDWTQWRDLEAFLQVAKNVGIYVVARPGPYINAETTGGGLPGWLSNVPAVARSNATLYTEAWRGYVQDFSQIVNKYQYPDGPVIAVQAENEFYEDWSGAPTATEYMLLLEAAFRSSGITKVPLIVNDVYPSGNYASGHPASVDIYGFDAYPGGFDCSVTTWNEMPTYFIPQDALNAPGNPMWIPEFQGGSLASVGGPAGFEGCYTLTGPTFANVYYKNNVASGSKAMSFYMAYGGTNWGLWAAIHESRALSDKYSEVKLQGLFYQASASLYASVIVGSGGQYTSPSSLFTTQLGNNSLSGSNYYVVRQGSNNITTDTRFKLNVVTPSGAVTIPQFGGDLILAGRESKIIVTGYVFGKSTITYSTVEVLTQVTLDDVDYVVLYAPTGHVVEAIIKGPTSATPILTGSSTVHATIKDSSVTLTGTTSSTSVVRWGKTVVIVVDATTAYTFWNPRTSNAYDLSPSVASVIVSGPYLVRSATVSSGTLSLVGDLQGPASLTVFAPSAVKTITWNGQTVKVSKSPLGIGLAGSVGTKVPNITVPKLSTLPWKSVDSLPEISPSFDDSTWVIANKTTTARPQQPGAGKYIVYADEYGFHAGSTVFRGYFNGSATGVNLWVSAGTSGAASIFLNGKFLASNQTLSSEDMNFTISFPTGSLVTTGSNVLTVLVENTGLDTDWNADDSFKTPRGIRGYQIVGGSDISVWKIAGTLGGENYPDKVRGPYNEGGLWVERAGAILPGYDYSKWKAASPLTGSSAPGVTAYRSSFSLAVPDGVDATFAVSFAGSTTSRFRVQLFINGWQFGRYTNYGPQSVFPVPQGILNHNGSNDIVVTVWSLDAAGFKLDDIELVVAQAVISGKPKISGLVTSPNYSQLR